LSLRSSGRCRNSKRLLRPESAALPTQSGIREICLRGKSAARRCNEKRAKGGIPISHRQTPSIQDYLKVLLELSESGCPVLSIDIAQALGFSRASVCRAMNVLKADGYITKEKYGPVTLTAYGREAALSVRKRHDLLMAFLVGVLGVENAAAEADACRMEHAVSKESAQKLERFLDAYGRMEQSDCVKR